jgi:hypothetical protein
VLPERLEYAADEKDVVDDCKAGEEAVEDAAHLLAQQDRDRDGIGHKTKGAQHGLRGNAIIRRRILRNVFGFSDKVA